MVGIDPYNLAGNNVQARLPAINGIMRGVVNDLFEVVSDIESQVWAINSDGFNPTPIEQEVGEYECYCESAIAGIDRLKAVYHRLKEVSSQLRRTI